MASSTQALLDFLRDEDEEEMGDDFTKSTLQKGAPFGAMTISGIILLLHGSIQADNIQNIFYPLSH